MLNFGCSCDGSILCSPANAIISPKINQSPFLLKRQWSAWKPQSRCTFLFLEVSSKPCYYAVYSFPLPKIYNLPFIITQNLISNLIIHFIKVTFWIVLFGLAITLLFVNNISKCNGKPKFCDHPVFFFWFRWTWPK